MLAIYILVNIYIYDTDNSPAKRTSILIFTDILTEAFVCSHHIVLLSREFNI